METPGHAAYKSPDHIYVLLFVSLNHSDRRWHLRLLHDVAHYGNVPPMELKRMGGFSYNLGEESKLKALRRSPLW